jgi:tetratricopeptide (TPR) repeat protein
MDAPLFYQLLIGEMELRRGQAGTAYEVVLDAARRTREPAIFRRAVDIALQGRALEQALGATRAWRTALPDSLEALRLQIQILVASGRASDLNEPLRSLVRLTPAAERPGLISALPRFLERGSDARLVASVLSDVLKPYAEATETRIVARVAIARAWLNAKEPDIALALAQDAQRLEPDSPGPSLVALELLSERPAAETIVKDYLARPKATNALRLAYVRVLTSSQRYAEAAVQLEQATRAEPQEPGAFLTLGVLQVELRQPEQAQASLLRYIELVQAKTPAAAAAASAASTAASASPVEGVSELSEEEEEAAAALRPDRGLVQAWLSLAQVAEQRGDFKAAESWLAKVDDPRRALEVQTRRAVIQARQGQVAQARETIRRVPERSPEDARGKLLAEAGVLREVKRWNEAKAVLATANERFPNDPDLLYEQAMMAEKTDRMEEMELLLRRVIEIRPENPHAHNALGYSLADRGLRLTEARTLIARALELSPGDPFITDSLGWVEFKLGRSEEALRLLRLAYSARPDPEIGAHLGEVLWSMGNKDEARKIWREARERDGANDVLRETLARLRADP